MGVFAAAESDLALRFRRSRGGVTRRMDMRSRALAAAVICGVFAVTLPSSGMTDQAERGSGEGETVRTVCGVDWEAIKTTPPEEWSDEIVDQIVASDCDLEAISERIRRFQQEESTRTDGEGQQTDLDALGRRIRAAIERGDMSAEEGRRLMAEARETSGHDGDGEDRLSEFKREIIEAAMATPVDDWSDELKARIARAGWDVDELAEGIRKRQEHEAGDGASRIEVAPGTDTGTAVEEESWGRVKEDAADSK